MRNLGDCWIAVRRVTHVRLVGTVVDVSFVSIRLCCCFLQAFCEEGNIKNGVLMFIKYVLIPVSGRDGKCTWTFDGHFGLRLRFFGVM